MPKEVKKNKTIRIEVDVDMDESTSFSLQNMKDELKKCLNKSDWMSYTGLQSCEELPDIILD